MPSAVVTAPDGAKLTVPFDGAAPDPGLLSAAVDHYMSTAGRSASSAPPSLATDPGTPLTPGDLAAGRAAIAAPGNATNAPANVPQTGQSVPSVSPPPMVPVNTPYKAVQAIIAPYKAKQAAGGQVTDGDVAQVKAGLTQYMAKRGPDYFATPDGKATAQDLLAKGWFRDPDELHAAAAGQPGALDQIGGFLKNVAVPDAVATGKGFLHVLGGIGAALDTEGGGDVAPAQTAQDRQALLSALDPRNLPKAPGIGPAITAAGGALQYLNTSGGYAAPPSQQVAAGVSGVKSDFLAHPVQTALNLAPLALHGLGTLPETLGNFKARAAADGPNIPPPADGPPRPGIPPVYPDGYAPPAVHPLDAAGVPPLHPASTPELPRALSGRFVEKTPAAVQAANAPTVGGEPPFAAPTPITTPGTGVLIGDVGRSVSGVQQMKPGMSGNANLRDVKTVKGPITEAGQQIQSIVENAVAAAKQQRDSVPSQYAPGDTVSLTTGEKAQVVSWPNNSETALVRLSDGREVAWNKKAFAPQEAAHAPQQPDPQAPPPEAPAAAVAAPAVPSGGPQVGEPLPAQPAVPHPDEVEAQALARIQARQKPNTPPPAPPVPVEDARLAENFPVDQLHVDPERFQYKIGSGQGGQTGSLSGAPAFNQDLAGIVHVWKDPADGQTYVVNGHNRVALANRLGTKGMDVRYIDAATADEARTKGAMINIAEGQGTAIDAAKLFREQGMTPDSIAGQGINLKGQKASQGLALSNLSPSLFGQVVRGELPIERGALIGDKLPDVADQQILTTLLDKYSAKGKVPTNDVVSELADQIKNGPKNTETTNSLFGDDTATRSTALERAEVSSYIKGQLGQEGKVFGGAAKNADRLAKGNNVIDAATSAKIAETSRQGGELFDRFKNSSGPVSDILNAAATRIAKGENANAVKADALRQYQQAVPDLAAGRTPETADPGAGQSLPTGAGDGGTGGQPQQGPDLFGGEPAAPSIAPADSLRAKLDHAATDAAARISARNKGRASSGVDPADLADMAIWGAARIAKGAVDFGEWSRQMVGAFGESIRPHLQDLYAEAQKQHGQIFGRPALEASPTAEPTPPATAGASPATAPKKAPAEYAGSINLDRMGVSDAAKQVIRDATDRLHRATPDGPPTLTHADALAAANALSLTPEMAKQIPLGESPSGVHPGIYNLALRNLVAKQAEALRTIPADDPARPALQAENDDTVARSSALSRSSGQSLSLHNAIASPIDGAVAEAQSKMQALQQVPALTQPLKPSDPAISVTTKPGRAGYGEKNTIVKKADADAALARLKQSAGRVNSGIDPVMLKDFAVWGAYHLEAGLRKFADFAGQVDKDFPGHDTAQKQQIYAAARAEYAQGAQNRLKQTGQMVFADALAPRLGRQGASDYINALADGPHPDLLHKILTGNHAALTPAEKQFANDTLRDNQPAKGKGVSQQSLTAVNAISKEFADANRRASLQRARANRRLSNPAPLPDPLTKTLLGRVGRVNAPEFVNRLNADADTAGVVNKLKNGQALTDGEKRAVAGHLDDLRQAKTPAAPSDISKELTGIVRDAMNGKLGFESAKAVVQHELTQTADPGQIGAANAELASVDSGDTDSLAVIHAKYSPSSIPDKIIFGLRSGLLSGPKTLSSIIASHLLGATAEDTITRGAAALADPIMAKILGDKSGVRSIEPPNLKATGEAAKAGLRAIPEGLQLFRHGEAAMQLRGEAPSFNSDELRRGLQVEPLNATNVGEHGRKIGARFGLVGEKIGQGVGKAVGGAIAYSPRTHGAVFHVIGKALFERGRIEAASLKARDQGGDPMQYKSDPDVLKAAAQYRREQLYQNKNSGATGVNALVKHSGPVGGTLIKTQVPFSLTPMNLAMRGAEYSGAGLPLAVARAANVRLTGRDFAAGEVTSNAMTPEAKAAALLDFRRNVSRQAGRGLVGLGGGMAAGYGLTKAGGMTPPNAKEHLSGSINTPAISLFGHHIAAHSFDDSRFEPLINGPNLGGEIANAANGNPADFISPFTNNPYFSGAQGVTNALEAANGKPGGIWRFAGKQLSEYIPTILAQAASVSDPSGQTRKQTSFQDFLMNKIPGLREKLPTTGRPQMSNIKAVGAPLALLSPVGVSPRK